MDEKLIEAMARAIFEHIKDRLTEPQAWDAQPKPVKRAFRAEARAALRAQTDRIAKLEAEVARLREALSAIGGAGYVQPKDAPLLHNEAVDIARRALTTGDKP